MALLDAYASQDEYRSRVGDNADEASVDLDEQLEAASRLLERSLQVAPGAFNSHAGTYTFDAHGGTTLWLRDSAGMAYFLQSIDADLLTVGTGDGAFAAYALDLADTGVIGRPENASVLGEPYRSIELLSSAPLTSWPDAPYAVRITGTWGWSAVPRAIKELAIHLVHDLRQAHLGGALQEIPSIDGSLPLSDQSWRIWRRLEQDYGRRLPVFA